MRNFTILLIMSINLLYGTDYSYYANTARKITADTAYAIQKQNANLNIAGQGSSLMDEISMLGISFQYQEKLSINHAREIIVDYTELLKKNINKSKELRPFLSNYPFTENNIQTSVFITKDDGTLKEDLHYATLCRGKIKYCNGFDVLKNVMLSETYEEALAKVQQSTQNP